MRKIFVKGRPKATALPAKKPLPPPIVEDPEGPSASRVTVPPPSLSSNGLLSPEQSAAFIGRVLSQPPILAQVDSARGPDATAISVLLQSGRALHQYDPVRDVDMVAFEYRRNGATRNCHTTLVRFSENMEDDLRQAADTLADLVLSDLREGIVGMVMETMLHNPTLQRALRRGGR